MNISAELHKLDLHPGNSIVIGSGILNALNIRDSNDIDVIVTQDAYSSLKRNDRLIQKQKHGLEVITDDLFEIGTNWGVLGKNQTFSDLMKNSVIVEGVRYITLSFLLQVKESWLKDKTVRQKDIDDVQLIRKYLKLA